MKFTEETITPEMAAAWLGKNIDNRRIRPGLVSRYKREILAGVWNVTHQGIAFNQEGVLVDGQHRLLAIVAANKPIYTVVCRGLKSGGAMSHYGVDRGASRSLADNANESRDMISIARVMQDVVAGGILWGDYDALEALKKYRESITAALNGRVTYCLRINQSGSSMLAGLALSSHFHGTDVSAASDSLARADYELMSNSFKRLLSALTRVSYDWMKKTHGRQFRLTLAIATYYASENPDAERFMSASLMESRDKLQRLASK